MKATGVTLNRRGGVARVAETGIGGTLSFRKQTDTDLPMCNSLVQKNTLGETRARTTLALGQTDPTTETAWSPLRKLRHPPKMSSNSGP